MTNMNTLRVIDSHTGGEPTRTIVEGGPALVGDTIAAKLDDMQRNHDGYRKSIVNEPRGSEVMVGAYLIPPTIPNYTCGIIFFNNVGYLGMCGHGTIGVVATLAHIGKLAVGTHRFETVAGPVSATLNLDSSVTIENVPSYRIATGVALHVEGIGVVLADIAYAGNWFCLVQSPWSGSLNRPKSELLDVSSRILEACRLRYPDVDHVEIFGTPTNSRNHSRNFVLCPGGMYDRSPCGTGTSAKLACLAADGKLREGEVWHQESIIGSTFQASYRWLDETKGLIAPCITGRAFVNGDLQVIIDPEDPFAWGF
jgi:4-hydroxyproline epimerase